MLTAALSLLATAPNAIPPGDPAECRHEIISRTTEGQWHYVAIYPHSDGTIEKRSGAVAIRLASPDTVEVSYPGTARTGFRLVRTATGYRSEGPDSSGRMAVAEVRVESCTAPDANGIQTVVEIAEDEPGPDGGRVQSYGLMTATADMILIEERIVLGWESRFSPPAAGSDQDRVLVLDRPGLGFPLPGAVQKGAR